MIMEQDLDELFGDSTALSLPQSQPVYSISQRIDELHSCGCTQYAIFSYCDRSAR